MVGPRLAPPLVVALYPQPNENAWLLGYAAMQDGSLTEQRHMGMVGARGLAPPVPICRIVLPEWIVDALSSVA